MNSTRWAYAAGGVGLAALATVLALKSGIGPLIVQCYPGTDECALILEAQPEQCPALLRDGGSNFAYQAGIEEEALGLALATLKEEEAIITFVTERRLDANGQDLPCVVNVFLTREQANALKSAVETTDADPQLANVIDGVTVSDEPPQGGVVLAGQADVSERTETFEIPVD